MKTINCSSELRVNRKNHTIEMTKGYSKKSEIYGSREYRELLEVCKDYPTYDIAILRKKSKDSHKGLDLDYMKKYIDEHDENGKVKEVFEKCTTTKNNKLALVEGIAFFDLREWFFVQFPEIKDRKALEAKENVISINETLKSKVRIAN